MIEIFGWFWTSAIVVLTVGLILLIIGIYNNLVAQRQNVRQGVADIDAQLKQRHDLIPNLVETVKGYAGHEASTLENVIQARNAAAKGNPSSGNEQGLKLALDNLLALGEDYPELKAILKTSSPLHAVRLTPPPHSSTPRANPSLRLCLLVSLASKRRISIGSMTAKRVLSIRFRKSRSKHGVPFSGTFCSSTIFDCASADCDYIRALAAGPLDWGGDKYRKAAQPLVVRN